MAEVSNLLKKITDAMTIVLVASAVLVEVGSSHTCLSSAIQTCSAALAHGGFTDSRQKKKYFDPEHNYFIHKPRFPWKDADLVLGAAHRFLFL